MPLSLYKADQAYCDLLRSKDYRVPNISGSKAKRPFVGVVLEIKGITYFAPLSSPKPKHKTMKNQVDFLKIRHGDLGIINFNNMIPIHLQDLTKINPTPIGTDSVEDKKYKSLLANQLSWCNANRERITKAAEKIYHVIRENRGWPSLVDRTCDFGKLEALYIAYGREKGYVAENKEPIANRIKKIKEQLK